MKRSTDLCKQMITSKENYGSWITSLNKIQEIENANRDIRMPNLISPCH